MGKQIDLIKTRALLRKTTFIPLVSKLEPKCLIKAMEGESWRKTMK